MLNLRGATVQKVQGDTSRNSVFILGCRSSGKTSFLMGLALLSRPHHKSHFSLQVNNKGTASFVSDLKRHADSHRFPPPTPDFVLLDFDVGYKGRTFPLCLLEYPGEDLLAYMETLDEQNKEPILEHFSKADVVLLLLDPTQDLNTDLNADTGKAARRLDALAMAVGRIASTRQAAKLPEPVIGIVISKSDLLSDAAKARVVSDNKVSLTNLAKYAQSADLPRFHLSSSGSISEDSQRGSIPEFPRSPLPTGFDEVFDWLGSQLDSRRLGRVKKAVATVAIACAFLFGGYGLYRHLSDRDLANKVGVVDVSELRRLVNRPELSEYVQKALNDRANKELNILEERGKSLLPQNPVGFRSSYRFFDHVDEHFREVGHGDDGLEFRGDSLGIVLGIAECLA